MVVALHERETIIRTQDTPDTQNLTWTPVAEGAQRESRIDLITLTHEQNTYASVFIYPAIGYRIAASRIDEIDTALRNGKMLLGKEFKELPSEELDHAFLELCRREGGLVSTVDRTHHVRKVKLIEHAYHPAAHAFLSSLIKEIKGQ